jgi:hypothetical protein
MAPTTKSPAAASDGARATFGSRTASNPPKIIAPQNDIQVHRAHWLARRFSLAPAHAAVVASLVFGETAR